MNLTLYTPFIVPFLVVIAGIFGLKVKTKPNSFLGYRTKRAQQSDDAWNFAQKYFGKLWLIYGLFLWVVSLLMVFLMKDFYVIGLDLFMIFQVILLVVLVIMTVYIVENELKKKFSNDDEKVK